MGNQLLQFKQECPEGAKSEKNSRQPSERKFNRDKQTLFLTNFEKKRY